MKQLTYIEFFVKDSIENLCACLARCPERVILIGDRIKQMKKHAERYADIFAQRGHNIEFICRSVNKNDLTSIVKVLSEIVETYENCAFGLTGGEDLCLVAMGIVFERYRDLGLQMHRFNIRNGTMFDCDHDGNTLVETEIPQLSVRENIVAYGGDVIFDEAREDSVYRWSWSEDFCAEVDMMWSICRRNPRAWNSQLAVFAAAHSLCDAQSLTLEASMDELMRCLAEENMRFIADEDILRELRRAGLITHFEQDELHMKVGFKDEQVKRCLVKAGQILEMKITLEALMLCDEDGGYVYNDVMNGVYIDWDGEISTDGTDFGTENEIDVMMMHGMVPVFVSCKNGRIEIDELYKLNTVAERFGGDYAKKVLVASALDTDSLFAEYFLARAKDMGINVITSAAQLSNEELAKELRKLWNS